MEIRRLNPDDDLDLYRAAYDWDADYPRWYKLSDMVFRPTWEDFIAQAKADDQADVGIFVDGLIGLISLTMRTKGIYEATLWAKRRSSVAVLVEAAITVRESLRTLGMREVYSWINFRNTPVQKLCMMAGMQWQGVTMIKGCEGKLSEWKRYAVS